MNFETMEIFPNKSSVALTDHVEQLYTIDLTEDARGMYVSSVMTRDELSALYIQVGRLLYPNDPTLIDLMARVDQINVALSKTIPYSVGWDGK